jgi:hypothetical protein
MIVLAIIIVGIAIAISVQLFRSNAVEAKRDVLIEETSSLAAMAIQYFKKPSEMGGGGKSFIGWSIPHQMVQTVEQANRKVRNHKHESLHNWFERANRLRIGLLF